MSVSVVDGTIEEAVLGRRAAKVQFFKHITFRLADGGQRSIAKAVAHSQLAGHLKPGASGRFYLFTAIDHRGVHGFRDRGGRALFHYPRNNEVIMLVLVILMALWAAVSLAVIGDVGIIQAVILLLGPIAWFFFRKTRLEAQRQFEADCGYSPASAPAAAPQPVVGA